MEVLTFYSRIFPLFINILLGWILGKKFGVTKDAIAKILIYFAVPVVVFNAIYTSPISVHTLLLPLIAFTVCLIVSHVFLFIGKFILKDNRANLLAFSVGNGNAGYFGVPLVLALFGDSFINTYIFAVLGVILYENTFGVYLISRGKFTIKDSLINLIKLPVMYALIAGFMAKFIGLNLGGDTYTSFVTNYRGVYATLGVTLVGVALSQIEKIEFDKTFVTLNLVAKFVVWPILMFTFIYLDSILLHLLTLEMHKILLILSIVPLPANAIAYASLLNIHPEKAAVTVFISTIFALIYIPLFVSLFF